METAAFGVNQRGEKASLYTLENKKHTVIKVSDHGATLVSVLIPDKDGVIRDVMRQRNMTAIPVISGRQSAGTATA